MARPTGLLLALLLLPPALHARTGRLHLSTVTDAPLAQVSAPNALLDLAESLLAEGNFEQAIAVVQERLADDDVPRDELAELYRLLGLAHLYLGDEEAARAAYEKLLEARPDYELPRSAPPKIQELYARIEEDIRQRRAPKVTLTVHSIGSHPGGQPLTVFVKVGDLPVGGKPLLHHRRRGTTAWNNVAFTPEPSAAGTFIARVPAFALVDEGAAYEVEYYIEVQDPEHGRVAESGTAEQPQRFTVTTSQSIADAEAAEKTSAAWYKRPWVWIVGGVVLAGATTAVVLVATNDGAE